MFDVEVIMELSTNPGPADKRKMGKKLKLYEDRNSMKNFRIL